MIIVTKSVELEGEIATKIEAQKNQKCHDPGTLNWSQIKKKERTKKGSKVLHQCKIRALKLRGYGMINPSLTLHKVKNEVLSIFGSGGKEVFERTSGHSEKSAMKIIVNLPMIEEWDDCTKHKTPEIVLKGKYELEDNPEHKEETSFDCIWHCMKPRHFIPGSDSSLRNPVVNMLLNATVSPGSTYGNPQSQATPNNTTLHHPTHITGIAWLNFERETMRLASFSRYPVNSVKSATVLANSGFVYVGEGRGDKVICYFCCAVKENWKPEEDVVEVHKRLCTNCPMVTITESNNTATLTSVEGATSTENYNYSIETSTDQELAAAASGYTRPQQTRSTHASDQHQQLNYLNSTRSQPPISQAQRHTSSLVSPETNSLPPPQNGSLHTNINSQINSIPCIPQNGSLHTNTHINSIPCVPLSVPAVNPASQPAHQTTSPLVRDLNLQDLGIFYERPKKPEYAILAKRIESFQGWPVDSPVTKEDVAKSGFYYEGYKDGGRCFFCGGILGEWKSGDDPFVEHARWYPKCGYIRQYKGQAFIDIVQKIKTHSSNITQITSAMVVEEMNRLGLEESNAFDEDPVEHDAAVTSLLDEIMSLKSTLRYTREEVIHAAQILRRQSIALSSDLILSQLTHNHDATYSGAQGATASLGASNAGTIEELKDQNSTLRSNLICKICMDKEVKIVFLPCGHLVSCQECAMALYNCPICLSQIRAYVRANIRSL